MEQKNKKSLKHQIFVRYLGKFEQSEYYIAINIRKHYDFANSSNGAAFLSVKDSWVKNLQVKLYDVWDLHCAPIGSQRLQIK